MTIEVLERAKELEKLILKFKNAIDTLNENECEIRYLKLNSRNLNKLIVIDEELKNVMINYFESKLKELESEFEKL